MSEEIVTVTVPVGILVSATVYVAVAPAATSTVAGVNANPFSSSSVSVRSAPFTAPMPWSFTAVPETVTVLSAAASTSLSSAVIVTTPPLDMFPAAIVSVVAVLNVKSSAVAGATGVAVTITVVGWTDGCDSAAVTVEIPPFSGIEAGSSASVTVGGPSSSVVVTSTSTPSRPS